MDSGRNPKITLRSLAERSSLRYTCVKALGGFSGTCIARELPDEWEEIAAWSEKLGVDYCGERLPGLAYKAFQALLKAARKTPSKLEQVEILKRQAGKCTICAGVFDDDVVWDHQQPLRQLQKAQKQEFRAICASCSAEITPWRAGESPREQIQQNGVGAVRRHPATVAV